MALQVGYGGGAVGSDFTMCKEKAKTCKDIVILKDEISEIWV